MRKNLKNNKLWLRKHQIKIKYKLIIHLKYNKVNIKVKIIFLDKEYIT